MPFGCKFIEGAQLGLDEILVDGAGFNSGSAQPNADGAGFPAGTASSEQGCSQGFAKTTISDLLGKSAAVQSSRGKSAAVQSSRGKSAASSRVYGPSLHRARLSVGSLADRQHSSVLLEKVVVRPNG